MTDNQIVKQENQIGITRQAMQSNDMIDTAYRMAQFAARSSLTKVQNEFDAFFIIQYGWELGLTPMASLRTIYVVNGTPTCSGEAMLALIRRSGLCTKLEITGDDKQAVVIMERNGSESYTATFSIADANKANLTGKQVWKQYPAKMLKWRAVSECAKFLFGDIIGGLYTVEEIAPASDLNEAGDLVGEIVITDDKPQQEPPPSTDDDDIVIDGEFDDPVADSAEQQVTAAVQEQQRQQAGDPPPSTDTTYTDEGEFKKHLWQAVDFMYDNEHHKRNSLKKLMENDVVNLDMTMDKAIFAIMKHRAHMDLFLGESEYFDIFGMAIETYYENNGAAKTWQQFNDYFAARQEPATPKAS